MTNVKLAQSIDPQLATRRRDPRVVATSRNDEANDADGRRDRWRAALELFALAAIAAAATLAVAGEHGTVRVLVTGIALLLGPGLAALSWARIESPLAVVCIAVPLSLALLAITSYLMALTDAWLPWLFLSLAGIAAAIALCLAIRRRMRSLAGLDIDLVPRPRRIDLRKTAPLVPLAAALALWAYSLHSVDVSHLGESGLIAALPIAWYVALFIAICSAIYATWTEHPNVWVIATAVITVGIILFATVPLVSDVPQYAWTYKHIGVARLIGLQGHLSPNIDIYNRWPGFFTFAAIFSKAAGTDPIGFAAWSEPFFSLLDAAVIAAIARSVTRDARITGLAATVYLVSNWVGQAYFAPQALAFVASLAMIFVAIQNANHAELGFRRRARRLRRLSWRPRWPEKPPKVAELGRAGTPALLLTVNTALVCSHQLTPYIVVMQFAVLTALGVARPKWLVLAFAATTIAFLIPHFWWVQHNYGVLNSFNFFDNAQVVVPVPRHRAFFFDNVGLMLSFTLGVFGIIGALLLLRRRYIAPAVIVTAMVAAPFLVLFGQNYGGEAPLRVVLFASPWLSMLIAGGIGTMPRFARLFSAAFVALTLAGLMLFAFFGNAATNIMPKDEVTASDYFLNRIPKGSVLMLAGEGFPTRLSARYAALQGPAGDAIPNLLEADGFTDHVLGAADVETARDLLLSYPGEGFLVFSKTQELHAAVYRTTPAGSLQSLERAIAASPDFKLWYRTENTRFYEVVQPARRRGSERRR